MKKQRSGMGVAAIVLASMILSGSHAFSRDAREPGMLTGIMCDSIGDVKAVVERMIESPERLTATQAALDEFVAAMPRSIKCVSGQRRLILVDARSMIIGGWYYDVLHFKDSAKKDVYSWKHTGDLAA